MDFRSPYVNRPEESPGLEESSAPSMTMQQFAQEADINFLIDRYKKTGSYYNPLSVSGTPRMPMFEDISDLPDVPQAVGVINEVSEYFAALPATVRAEFDNSIATFVAFAQNPANYDKCVALGVFPRATIGAPEGGDGPAPALEAHKPNQGGEPSSNTPLNPVQPAAAL